MAKRNVRGHAYRWVVNDEVLRQGMDAIHQRSRELLQFETMRSVIVEGLFMLLEMPGKELLELVTEREDSTWWRGTNAVYLGLDKEEIAVLTDVRARLTEAAGRNITTGETFSIAACAISAGRRRKHRVGGRKRIV